MAKEKNDTNATNAAAAPNATAAPWSPPAPLKYRLNLQKSGRNPIDQTAATALARNIVDAARKGVSLEEYAKALFLMPNSEPVDITAPPKERSLEERALGAVARINAAAWNVYRDAAIERGVEDFPDLPAIRSAYGAGVTSSRASAAGVADAEFSEMMKLVKGG